MQKFYAWFLIVLITGLVVVSQVNGADKGIDTTKDFAFGVVPVGGPSTIVYFLPEMKDQVLFKQHEMISSSKKTIDVAMFGMTSAKNNPYVQDLVDACKRGVKVRVYRDQGQSAQKLSSLANDMIVRAGGKDKHCQVRVKKVRTPIQHSKYTIVDNEQVLWGSVNESASGMIQDNVEEYNTEGTVFESNFVEIWKTGIDWAKWKNKKKSAH